MSMGEISASTVNVRLSVARKLVEEARPNGMLGAEEAANLTDVPNIRQQGTRLRNWLTKEQARELLQVPIVRSSRASAITRSWLFWWAARCAATSSPLLRLTRCRCARAGGCSPI